jgi:hypothetical protein
MTKFSWYCAAILGLAACREANLAGRITDPRLMRDSILALAPPGTTVDSAKLRVEAKGFGCTTQHGVFAGHDSSDYLWCDASDGGVPVFRRWQVALFLKSGRVADVAATTGLIGP